MLMPETKKKSRRNLFIVLGVIVVLLIAMVLSTKFLTPEELAAVGPKKFDPKQSASELWTKAQTEIPANAQPLGQVVPAMQKDLKAAATKYKAVSPAEGAYAFPVKFDGTVEEASDASLRVSVPGVPEETAVIIPLTTAINGTAVRDAMGFKFADAPGQTEYQFVGDELKKLMQEDVKSSISDPASLKGKKVSGTGVVVILSPSGAPPPPAKPVNVQPVTIEAGS
jgi:predicted lipoprotein